MADGPLPPKPPLPRWFWFTLAALVVAMLASLAASVLLPNPSLAPGHPAPKLVKVELSPAEPSPIAQPAVSPTVSLIVPMDPVSPTVTEFPAPSQTVELPTPTIPLPPVTRATPAHLFWQTNSHAAEYAEVKGPRLAIVIDDMGVSPAETKLALDLPKAVTFSFLSYGAATPKLSQQAFDNGHDIMMHLPMEPLPHPIKLDPGPDTLQVGDAPDVLLAKLEHHLQQLGAISVGVNNHMGSRFTAWPEGMRTVLQQLDNQGYMFLDSLTINPTVTTEAAKGLGLPVLRRDVFLDHDPSPEAIAHELDRAVALAKKKGFAIAIGHPLPATLGVLFDKLPTYSGVTLVPVTAGLPAVHK
ncbi:MAG TPA: divergent polysaccharide deacetylase family protein [Alphaproteobacteria bacterium]|nr:divergent polysaccharide deacetylase family protein [Alphaproteobacteria bacterium]